MSTYKKHALMAVTVVLSSLICLYYFVYFLLCLAGFDSRLMCFFAMFVMAIAAMPIIFREKLRSKLGRAFKVLHIIFTALLAVYAISVVVFWGYILIDADNTSDTLLAEYEACENRGADTVIMVFGCRAYGMSPSLTLRLRLDTAYELLIALPDAVCIVSGGQGNNEIAPEAEVMKNYLVSLGIDEDRIILEPNAHSTSENVRYTKELVSELGLDDKRVIGVSTSFHLPRIELLAKRYDLQMDVCSSPSPSFGHFYVSMIREYLSYIKMAFFDKAVIITRVT